MRALLTMTDNKVEISKNQGGKLVYFGAGAGSRASRASPSAVREAAQPPSGAFTNLWGGECYRLIGFKILSHS